MNRFRTTHVLISIVVLFLRPDVCHGYVCIRIQGASSPHRSMFRVMAEPTSSTSHEETGERANRVSKRKRMTDIALNLRRRLHSLRRNRECKPVVLQQGVIIDNVEMVATPLSIDDELLLYIRQVRAAEHIDLSGTWKPIVTSEFKLEYDSYLRNCSQPFMFRKVVVNGIAYQKEVIRQLHDGVHLEIVATNPVGNWNRTLIASDELNPFNVTITDPDGDEVKLEAWWEENGTRHKSFLRGKPNVDGGIFETVRFLESDNVLVCESSFHPNPCTIPKFKYGHVVWKFQREQS